MDEARKIPFEELPWAEDTPGIRARVFLIDDAKE